jgi:hypothetical protein
MTSRVLVQHGSSPLLVPSTVLALSAQVEAYLWNLLAHFNLRPFWCCLKIAALYRLSAGLLQEKSGKTPKRGGIVIDAAPSLANDPKIHRGGKVGHDCADWSSPVAIL